MIGKKLCGLAILASGLLLGTTVVQGLDIIPGGFVPLSASAIAKAPAPEGDVMRFRGSHQLYVSPDADGRLSVELFNQQVGKYDTAVTYRLLTLDGDELIAGILKVNTGAILAKEGLAPGIYALKVNSGSNSVIVRNANGLCFVAATQAQPLHLIEDCPRLYFQVQGDSREVELIVKGDPPPGTCCSHGLGWRWRCRRPGQHRRQARTCLQIGHSSGRRPGRPALEPAPRQAPRPGL